MRNSITDKILHLGGISILLTAFICRLHCFCSIVCLWLKQFVQEIIPIISSTDWQNLSMCVLIHAKPINMCTHTCKTYQYVYSYIQNLSICVLIHAQPINMCTHTCKTYQYVYSYMHNLSIRVLIHLKPIYMCTHTCTTYQYVYSYI